MSAGLAVALMLLAAPLAAQDDAKGEQVWRVQGLRDGFCVLLLVDPQAVSKNVPDGIKLMPAAKAGDLHTALKSEIQSQPAMGSWSPSQLCFYSVDTLETDGYRLADKKGRKTQLFALWTVSGTETASGKRRDVAMLVVSSSERLIRSRKLASHYIRSAEAKVGKVPVVDENGVPNSDDRFQVKIGKTLVTWDGHDSADSVEAKGALETAWATNAGGEGKEVGSLTLTPRWASPMVGSLKVEGKDDLARALKASPVRFVGPKYRGGGGEIRLGR